jgi:hypothetical protein
MITSKIEMVTTSIECWYRESRCEGPRLFATVFCIDSFEKKYLLMLDTKNLNRQIE